MCKYFTSHLGERVARLAVEILLRFSCNDAPFRKNSRWLFSLMKKSRSDCALVTTCWRPGIGGSGFVNEFPVEKFGLRAKAGTIY